MKQYLISFVFGYDTEITVEAKSKKEALELARLRINEVDDTFEISSDVKEI